MAETDKLIIAYFSDKGTTRTNNEDNFYVSSHAIINEKSEDYCSQSYMEVCQEFPFVAAVFDGMGGTEGGEIASLASARQMSDFYELLHSNELATDSELSILLVDLKTKMEQETKRAMKDSTHELPGSTCCGIILKQRRLRPFWIGDSRLYLFRKNQLILLTKDHTIAQEKVDSGLLTVEEAETVSSRHYLTKYIGDLNNAFSIGSVLDVEPGDKYLLCTDGISDKFSAQMLAEYMMESPHRCIELLTREVHKESKDNATAMVIEFQSESKKQELNNLIKEKAKEHILHMVERLHR